MKKNIRHFFLLTAFAVGAIHVVNRFIDSTADIKNILKSDKGNIYQWKNGNIFYTKCGQGTPLLLIHDLSPDSSSIEWSRLIHKLEKKHTVYTLDLLGCGRSDKPFLTYTNYLYVQLITDFIQNIINEKTDILVSSHSLPFVILANNMNSDSINKIIAINPPSLTAMNESPSHQSAILKNILEFPIIGAFAYNLLMTNKNIYNKFYNEYFEKHQLVSSKIVDAYYEAAHKNRSHGRYLLASITGNYTDNNISHALKKMETPLYLIQSRFGTDFMKKADSYQHLNKNIEITYLSNCKLLPQLEIPDKISELIEMYLK